MTTELLTSVDFHLQLKRSQFKTPIEVIKKNFKNLQKLAEKHSAVISKNLTLLETNTTKEESLEILSRLIQQQELFSKKVSFRVKQHNEFISRLLFRIDKLNELKRFSEKVHNSSKHKSNSKDLVVDLANFYKDEINLLIVDYILKTSTAKTSSSTLDKNTGVLLAKNLNMDKLVDYDVILQGLNIYREIKVNKNLKILIDWCTENKKSLKTIKEQTNLGINLEFETYFQSFIEKIKDGNLFDALEVSNNYLVNYLTDFNGIENFDKITSGAALLCWNLKEIAYLQDPVTNITEHQSQSQEARKALSYYDRNIQTMDQIDKNVKPYKKLLDDEKWKNLADFFLFNFNALYGIDQNLEISLLLSIGATALRTRSCIHQQAKNNIRRDVNFDDYLINDNNDNNNNNNDEDDGYDDQQHSILNNECPICSIDLYELTSSLPLSHQVKSNIYDNPVMLPNGNIYQFDKLYKLNKNLNKNPDESMMNLRTNSSHDSKKQDSGPISFEFILETLSKYTFKDPVTGQMFSKEELVKVFPT